MASKKRKRYSNRFFPLEGNLERNQSNPNSLLYQIMTRFVLDKNPELKSDENLFRIMDIMELNTLNLIMHSDPFLKTNFLNNLIFTTKIPVIYLDFDLLYSGYIASKIISLSPRATLYTPTKYDLIQILISILIKLSEEKSILIIDSLNGFFNQLNEKNEAGRLVNSYIMLFSCIAKMSHSTVIVTSMTRKRGSEEWVLSITGRHILESKQMTKIQLEQSKSSMIANLLEEKGSIKKSLNIPIQSELF